jgi:ABC-type Fe3+ transport system permease subunit
LAILSILVAVIAAYRDLGQGFISSTSVEGMPLLFAVQPFAVPGLVLGTGAIIAALVLQAIRWDRQRDGRPLSRR